jgi:hypothetical protein
VNRPRRIFWVLLALLATGHAARAGDEQRGRRVAPLPAYSEECAACHVAYPPAMLPAASWQRLLRDLPHHYGTDASLDASVANELAAWLGANAGTGKRAREAPPEDRITQSRWFLRKHDDVPAAIWKTPAVQSAAHCTACHAQAAEGDFNEHAVRIPR